MKVGQPGFYWSVMSDMFWSAAGPNKGVNLSYTLSYTFVGDLEHYDCLLGWLESLQYIWTYVWFSVKVSRPGRYSSGMSDMLWSAVGPNNGMNLSCTLRCTFVGDLEHYECLLGWLGSLQYTFDICLRSSRDGLVITTRCRGIIVVKDMRTTQNLLNSC